MKQIIERPSGSCSSAAFCMALQHFGHQDVDKNTVADLHVRAQAHTQKGELFSKLAIVARDYGLDTTLVHSEKDLFCNDAQLLTPEVFDALVEEYQVALEEAVSLGAKSIQGSAVDAGVLRQYLDDGYVILLAGQRQDGSLHTVLVNGYNGDLLLYHDPDNVVVTKERDEGELERFSKTTVGSWMMAVRKDPNMVDRLRDSLDSYNKKACEYLKVVEKRDN